jgi:hypothetical protein
MRRRRKEQEGKQRRRRKGGKLKKVNFLYSRIQTENLKCCRIQKSSRKRGFLWLTGAFCTIL